MREESRVSGTFAAENCTAGKYRRSFTKNPAIFYFRLDFFTICAKLLVNKETFFMEEYLWRTQMI
ncbi:MAG TPA: hypothetical protein DDZ11_03035 [Lentisphaeria bacterium]|nr:hypothetical protein [Lentisphaeria bacterium]